MSLKKAIEHGKEKRKPYYQSGKFDLTCRPHGGCPYCLNNRMVKCRAEKEKALQQIQEEVELLKNDCEQMMEDDCGL